MDSDTSAVEVEAENSEAARPQPPFAETGCWLSREGAVRSTSHFVVVDELAMCSGWKTWT